jgi:hypothetical protein
MYRTLLLSLPPVRPVQEQSARKARNAGQLRRRLFGGFDGGTLAPRTSNRQWTSLEHRHASSAD